MLQARVRAGIVVLDDDRLALIERTRGDELYYVVPGGVVDVGESPIEAAKRESTEELGPVTKVAAPAPAPASATPTVNAKIAAEVATASPQNH